MTPAYADYYAEQCRGGANDRAVYDVARGRDGLEGRGLLVASFENRLRYESSTAGALLYLAERKQHGRA